MAESLECLLCKHKRLEFHIHEKPSMIMCAFNHSSEEVLRSGSLGLVGLVQSVNFKFSERQALPQKSGKLF